MLDTRSDDLAAGCIAFEAGQLLLALRAGSTAGGAEGTVPADLRSNEHIEARIRDTFPGDAILSEESPDSAARLEARRVWIVDPLDGTREYNEPPRDDWAVHVALYEDGELRAGAVALPARAMLFTTAQPYAAPGRADGPLRIAVSRTRPPAEADRLAETFDATLVPMGSAGAKTMAVVRGEVDAYVHGGGQYEWDSAAPAAVAAANGLHTSRLDGSPLAWNAPNPWLPDLLICRPADRERLLAVINEPAA